MLGGDADVSWELFVSDWWCKRGSEIYSRSHQI